MTPTDPNPLLAPAVRRASIALVVTVWGSMTLFGTSASASTAC